MRPNCVLAFRLLEELSEVYLSVEDLLGCILVEPFDPFAVFPQAILDLMIRNEVHAQPILLALQPPTLIFSHVSPRIDTITILLVIFVLAFIFTPILPSVDAYSFHIIINPFSLVFATI